MLRTLVRVSAVAFLAWIAVWILSKEDETVYAGLLKGKNVLLTGASSGIGEEAAYYYAKQGANVVIVARREQLLQQVYTKCQSLSPSSKLKYIVADFSQDDAAERVVSEAVSFLGSLDFLLLNHAYLLTSTDEVTYWRGGAEQYQRMKYSMDVNFMSYVRTTDAAMPHLKKTNGSICVISSLIVMRPMFSLPYGTSKSALNTFFTGLRQELYHRGEDVSITVIHLGLIPTEAANKTVDSLSAALGRELRKVSSLIPSISPAKCAEDIVRAFTRRESNVYYPSSWMLTLLRLFTVLVEDPDAYHQSIDNFLIFLVDTKNSIVGA